jgi:hypothetical protein
MSSNGEPSALLLAGGLLKVEPLTDEVESTSVASASTSSSAPLTPPSSASLQSSSAKKEKKSSSKLQHDDAHHVEAKATRARSASNDFSASHSGNATLDASLKFVDDQLMAVRKRLVAVGLLFSTLEKKKKKKNLFFCCRSPLGFLCFVLVRLLAKKTPTNASN